VPKQYFSVECDRYHLFVD